MKVLVDTSVLVASVWEGHPRHELARRFLVANHKLGISQHSVAELYAALTSLPTQPRLAPEDVSLVIEDLLRDLEVVPLDPADYSECLRYAVSKSITGGSFYDLLHCRAAKTWGAVAVATFNPKHFESYCRELGLEVVQP